MAARAVNGISSTPEDLNGLIDTFIRDAQGLRETQSVRDIMSALSQLDASIRRLKRVVSAIDPFNPPKPRTLLDFQMQQVALMIQPDPSGFFSSHDLVQSEFVGRSQPDWKKRQLAASIINRLVQRGVLEKVGTETNPGKPLARYRFTQKGLDYLKSTLSPTK